MIRKTLYVAGTLVGVTLAATAVLWMIAGTRDLEREPEPDYVDECEKCGKALTLDECHVLRSDPKDDADLGITAVASGGGTFMSATYCAEHFPD